jgi:UDP:flavonoid glycosyltransferase YjiC (YdhE family)
MTRIVVITFGTYGDVAPYVGLGAALRTAGYDVAVASQAPQRELIEHAGLEYRFLPKDTEKATRESEFAQDLLDGARMRPSRATVKQMADQLRGVGPAMAAASEDADLLLCCGPVSTLFGYHIAEAMNVPSAALHLQPLAKTGQFAPPVLTPRSFGRLGNRAMWRLGAMSERVYLKRINELRAELGLPALRGLAGFQRRRDAHWPMLFGFSEHVVPRPPDWRDGLRITGYWWPPNAPDYTPPTELAEFLAAGPAPVFVGFGSTATNKGAALSRIVTEAAARANVRVVLQSGWSRLESDGENILTIGSVPHEWLFPRMAAVVHHAGAGTAAAGLRAGVPAIPIPGIMDQPYWSSRLIELGVAPRAKPRRDLDAGWLAEAIHTTTTDPTYRSHAQHLSVTLATENGYGAAMTAIQHLLDTPATRAR